MQNEEYYEEKIKIELEEAKEFEMKISDETSNPDLLSPGKGSISFKTSEGTNNEDATVTRRISNFEEPIKEENDSKPRSMFDISLKKLESNEGLTIKQKIYLFCSVN